MRGLLLLLSVAGALLAPTAQAHEVRPGYLELQQTAPDTYDLLFKLPALGEEFRLGLYVSLPEGTQDVATPRALFTGGAYIERRTIRREGGLTGQSIAVEGLSSTFTDVLVRVQDLDGTTHTDRLTPTRPSFVVTSAPGTAEVALTYLQLGIEHILLGVDHLLFVLGLVLLVNNRWMLIKTITAFTVAHSITLAVATFGYATIPVPPLNAAIALSILFLGPEIMRARRGGTSLTIRQPWIVAFGFGLLHGFGFASGLTQMGLPQNDISMALFSFNVGVELGQLGFVALVLLLEKSFKVLEVRWPRAIELVPAYAVGGLGAYWTIDRVIVMVG
jgi:hydrogenase/urease accessory protein HupE